MKKTLLTVCAMGMGVLFLSNQQIIVNAVTSCSCNNITTPLYGDMCICGCQSIKDAYVEYTKECPIITLAQLDAVFAVQCKDVENTEDCEYFKKLPGDTTDLYKSCSDKLDSVKDDCEECNHGKNNTCKF